MTTSSPSGNSQTNPCSLCAGIDASMQNIQNLRPTAFNMKDLDDELHSMALIRFLPEEYKSLTHSLMLTR